MAHHRNSEAIDILCKIRGDKDASDSNIVREVELSTPSSRHLTTNETTMSTLLSEVATLASFTLAAALSSD